CPRLSNPEMGHELGHTRSRPRPGMLESRAAIPARIARRGDQIQKPLQRCGAEHVVLDNRHGGNLFPPRLSFVTYNLWLTERWPARALALERFLNLIAPDVLCVQELQHETQAFLDGALTAYDRVRDPFPGWTNEANIYWCKAFFEEIGHGAEEVGHLESERRLRWVRLRLKALGKATFAATAHLTTARRYEEAEKIGRAACRGSGE